MRRGITAPPGSLWSILSAREQGKGKGKERNGRAHNWILQFKGCLKKYTLIKTNLTIKKTICSTAFSGFVIIFLFFYYVKHIWN